MESVLVSAIIMLAANPRFQSMFLSLLNRMMAGEQPTKEQLNEVYDLERQWRRDRKMLDDKVKSKG